MALVMPLAPDMSFYARHNRGKDLALVDRGAQRNHCMMEARQWHCRSERLRSVAEGKQLGRHH